MASVAFATAFGLALLQALIGMEQQPSDANVLVSPLSGSAALTLALNAAGLPSATHAELLRALTQNRTVLGDGSSQEAAVNAELARLMAAVPTTTAASAASKASKAGGGRPKTNPAPSKVDVNKGEQVLVANALFTKEGAPVKQTYADAMAQKFKAKVATAKGPADVNAWVSGATNGLVPELLPSDAEFDMVLTNALYFKGKWLYEFLARDTGVRAFTTAKGAKRQVSMMSQEFRPGQVLTAQLPGSFRAVRLPYRSGNFSAIAVLPDNSTARPESLLPLFSGPKAPAAARGMFAPLPAGSGSTFNLASKATTTKGGLWQPVGEAGLEVQLPRFRLRSRGSLAAPLQWRMGVVAAFSDAKANFERAEADPNAPFYMTDVIQEVVLNVDEEGTEAAAATAALISVTSAPIITEPPPQLVFDRPFIFALVHDPTGVPLVLGVIRDPPAAQQRPGAKPGAGAAGAPLGPLSPAGRAVSGASVSSPGGPAPGAVSSSGPIPLSADAAMPAAAAPPQLGAPASAGPVSTPGFVGSMGRGVGRRMRT